MDSVTKARLTGEADLLRANGETLDAGADVSILRSEVVALCGGDHLVVEIPLLKLLNE